MSEFLGVNKKGKGWSPLSRATIPRPSGLFCHFVQRSVDNVGRFAEQAMALTAMVCVKNDASNECRKVFEVVDDFVVFHVSEFLRVNKKRAGVQTLGRPLSDLPFRYPVLESSGGVNPWVFRRIAVQRYEDFLI